MKFPTARVILAFAGVIAYFAMLPDETPKPVDSSLTRTSTVASPLPRPQPVDANLNSRRNRVPEFAGQAIEPGNRNPLPKPENTRVNLISAFGNGISGDRRSIATPTTVDTAKDQGVSRVHFLDQPDQERESAPARNAFDFQESASEEYLDFGLRNHSNDQVRPVTSRQNDLAWLRSLQKERSTTTASSQINRPGNTRSASRRISQSRATAASGQQPDKTTQVIDSETVAGFLQNDQRKPAEDESTAKRPEQKPVVADKDANAEIIGWPIPDSLFLDLEHLQKFEMTEDWSKSTLQAFRALNELEISDPESKVWITRCKTLANELRGAANELVAASPTHADSCHYMLQIAQKVKRRAEIWQQIHEIESLELARFPEASGSVLASQITHRSREVNFDSIDLAWRDYLMLDKALEILADPKSSPVRYQALAQRIMARVTSSALSEEQSNYAQCVIGDELGEQLRMVAAGPFDSGQFLVDLERYETKPSVGARERLSRHYQSLYWNRNDEHGKLAELLDDHYRNANVRFEISQALLDMIAPMTTTFHQPVTDRILGASVLGQSQITNQVRFQMVPDAERLGFQLQSTGRVLSNTRAHARGFTFSNLGNGQVVAFKTISIGEDGYAVEPTHVTANNQTRLTDIQGQMDGVPVFGGIARRIAHQQQESQGFQAKQIVENKLRNEFRVRIDNEVYAKLDHLKEEFMTKVLMPLRNLQLEPQPVQLQTTDQSAIVRYRLASLDQIAADTPRPLALPSSLANFQLHRSAINNMINRIHINGKSFTPEQFMDHLNLLLGRDDLEIPQGNHEDVSFEFDTRDPIQLDFQNNKVEIALRIRKLQIGKRTRWTNLIVKARYSPVAIGQTIRLTFDEEFGLRVKNNRLKLADQIAVRTIFSTLFQPEFQFNLLPQEIAQHPAASQLGITHMTLTEGWLGVSLSRIQPVPATQNGMDNRSTEAITGQDVAPPQPGQATSARGNSNRPGQSIPTRSSRFQHASSQGIIGDWR